MGGCTVSKPLVSNEPRAPSRRRASHDDELIKAATDHTHTNHFNDLEEDHRNYDDEDNYDFNDDMYEYADGKNGGVDHDGGVHDAYCPDCDDLSPCSPVDDNEFDEDQVPSMKGPRTKPGRSKRYSSKIVALSASTSSTDLQPEICGSESIQIIPGSDLTDTTVASSSSCDMSGVRDYDTSGEIDEDDKENVGLKQQQSGSGKEYEDKANMTPMNQTTDTAPSSSSCSSVSPTDEALAMARASPEVGFSESPSISASSSPVSDGNKHQSPRGRIPIRESDHGGELSYARKEGREDGVTFIPVQTNRDQCWMKSLKMIKEETAEILLSGAASKIPQSGTDMIHYVPKNNESTWIRSEAETEEEEEEEEEEVNIREEDVERDATRKKTLEKFIPDTGDNDNSWVDSSPLPEGHVTESYGVVVDPKVQRANEEQPKSSMVAEGHFLPSATDGREEDSNIFRLHPSAHRKTKSFPSACAPADDEAFMAAAALLPTISADDVISFVPVNSEADASKWVRSLSSVSTSPKGGLTENRSFVKSETKLSENFVPPIEGEKRENGWVHDTDQQEEKKENYLESPIPSSRKDFSESHIVKPKDTDDGGSLVNDPRIEKGLNVVRTVSSPIEAAAEGFVRFKGLDSSSASVADNLSIGGATATSMVLTKGHEHEHEDEGGDSRQDTKSISEIGDQREGHISKTEIDLHADTGITEPNEVTDRHWSNKSGNDKDESSKAPSTYIMNSDDDENLTANPVHSTPQLYVNGICNNESAKPHVPTGDVNASETCSKHVDLKEGTKMEVRQSVSSSSSDEEMVSEARDDSEGPTFQARSGEVGAAEIASSSMSKVVTKSEKSIEVQNIEQQPEKDICLDEHTKEQTKMENDTPNNSNLINSLEKVKVAMSGGTAMYGNATLSDIGSTDDDSFPVISGSLSSPAREGVQMIPAIEDVALHCPDLNGCTNERSGSRDVHNDIYRSGWGSLNSPSQKSPTVANNGLFSAFSGLPTVPFLYTNLGGDGGGRSSVVKNAITYSPLSGEGTTRSSSNMSGPAIDIYRSGWVRQYHNKASETSFLPTAGEKLETDKVELEKLNMKEIDNEKN